MSLLTRHEVARVIGMRAMQLAQGGVPSVEIEGSCDMVYIAARELEARTLDVRVRRGSELIDVRACTPHPCLYVLLDSYDAGTRGVWGQHAEAPAHAGGGASHQC